MPGRWRHKLWRDNRGGKWQFRIIWYQAATTGDYVRLRITDTELGECNFYPKSKADADAWWAKFLAAPAKTFQEMWALRTVREEAHAQVHA